MQRSGKECIWDFTDRCHVPGRRDVSWLLNSDQVIHIYVSNLLPEDLGCAISDVHIVCPPFHKR